MLIFEFLSETLLQIKVIEIVKIIMVSFFYFLTIEVWGQDIHFSQFESSPLNLSPAQTGSFDNDFRAVINHRNQWQSVTVPYLTIAASFEGKTFAISSIKPDFLAFGLLLNADKAGDGNFGTTQLKFSTAYHHQFKDNLIQSLAFGLNTGYNYQSIDYTKFYFGSQYNGFQYDENTYSGEVFKNNKLSYWDFSTGLQITGELDTIGFTFGIVYNHLNRPQQSFNDISDSKLDGKFNTYLFGNWKLNTNNYFLPSIVYYRQGVLNETDIGGIFKHHTQQLSFPNIYFGGWIRWKDAAIIKAGFDYRNITFGLSYDINFSKLYVASHGNGGYEISIIYQFDRTIKSDVPYLHHCPVFM